MRKITSFVVLAVLAITATPQTVEAQGWLGNDPYFNGQISYEEAVYIAQARRQCRITMGANNPYCQQMGMGGEFYNPYGWQSGVFNGYGSMVQYPYGAYQGSWGRIVPNAGGNPYFDAVIVPCQIAGNGQRWQKGVGTVLLTTIAGAAIGKAYNHAGKGALYGAGAGAGLALLNNAKYCSPPQQIQLPVQQTGQQMAYQNGGAPVSYQGQVAPAPQMTQTPTSTPQPVAEPVKTQELRMFRNKFEYEGQNVRVHQGTKVVVELRPGEQATKEIDPSLDVWFEVYTENRNSPTRKWEWVVIRENRGVYELPIHSGWEFGDPNTRPIV